MDVAAARYQPQARMRAQPVLDRDANVPAADDSGPECRPLTASTLPKNGALTSKTAESLTRRKFQRTATQPSDHEHFRKPSIPASATRRIADRRPSDSARRRSINPREGMRVPSGPRELPGSPGKRYAQTSEQT